MISNEYVVKLCLEHEVKRENKIVKKELIVALRGEIYFVKFIINLAEDDVEPGVIFGRSFLRMTKEITNFGAGTTTIYPDIDPFLEDTKEEEKSMDDWDQLLDFNLDDIPLLGGEELPSFEEAAKEALALRISQKFAMLGEVRPLLETMAYHDKYKKVLDDIWKDKVELDGMIVKEAKKESNSDDEEEYEIKRNKFGAPMYGPKPAPYLNCNDPAEKSLAIQTVTNPFRKISVWKKAISFLGSLPVPLKHVNWKPDYKGSYTKEEEATGQWRTEMRLWEETMLKPDHQDLNVLDNLKPWKKCCFYNFTMNSYYGKIGDILRIKLRKAESNEEIFTFVAWIRAFNIKEPIYAELYHEFYSNYEFDEVCVDDELQSKKIIKFILGGHAHNLTLMEFARRLGLYHADELKEDGFNVYFQGGLRSDDNFNAQETTGYDKIQKNDLWLLSMFDARHQNGYANVAWLIARWMKRKGAGTQRESQICCGQFIMKIARKSRVLTDAVLRSLSALIYCRDLDTTTLRELIDSKGRLIPEDLQPGVPRDGIPGPPRASMQDLYDRMGSMEIR
ncbi:hypothetical protein Tco_1292934 [Tanacetum coccineum]